MAFKMKYYKSSFPFKKEDSPTTELLDVLKHHGSGTERGNVGTREMTPAEMAANRYIAKTVSTKVPEKSRAQLNQELTRGRLGGETLEDQAGAMYEYFKDVKNVEK